MTKPAVAIVGRPNVGKSTLFNRLTESRQAIMIDQPGTTRDRIYGTLDLGKRSVTVIDTGGLELISNDDPIQRMIQMQADVAISEASLILFIVDGKTGITSLDESIAEYLRKSGRKVLLFVNKIDDYKKAAEAVDFYSLAMGEPIWMSSLHGLNLDPLLSAIEEELPEEEETGHADRPIRLAIVGQPNVGKSTLLNCFLKTDRVLTDNKAGTTRDPIEVPFEMQGKTFELVDTAGIRRVNQLKEHVDKISVIFAEKQIAEADIVLFVFDVTRPLAQQDKRIAGMILEQNKPCIAVANKWDEVENKEERMKELQDEFEEDLYFLKWCPLVTISALTSSRVAKLQDKIMELIDKLDVKVSTHELNNLIKEAMTLHQPPGYKGRQLKIYYVTQVPNKRATFLFHVNSAGLVHFSYHRYLENLLRKHYGFEGLPLRLIFRGKDDKEQ